MQVALTVHCNTSNTNPIVGLVPNIVLTWVRAQSVNYKVVIECCRELSKTIIVRWWLEKLELESIVIRLSKFDWPLAAI
jgi:hypothetical protein